MTQDAPAPSPDPPTQLPPDPEAYDAPRAAQARARGLAAPYIAGGDDPNLDSARREERRYLRILIAFIVALILSGFVLGVIEQLIRASSGP